LRKRKRKGFYLGNQLILEHVGRDNVSTYYKARNIRDGKLTRLTVTPVNGQVEYQAVPWID